MSPHLHRHQPNHVDSKCSNRPRDALHSMVLQVSGALTAQAGCILENLDNYVAGALPLGSRGETVLRFFAQPVLGAGLLSPEMLQRRPPLLAVVCSWLVAEVCRHAAVPFVCWDRCLHRCRARLLHAAGPWGQGQLPHWRQRGNQRRWLQGRAPPLPCASVPLLSCADLMEGALPAGPLLRR